MNNKQYLAGLYPEELQTIVAGLNHPVYRSKQIQEWIFKKSVLSFSEMKNLPGELREKLEIKNCPVSLHQKLKLTSAVDKTSKYIFITDDDNSLETVLIPTAKRATVCVSTQVGCAFGCLFCASGSGGLVRDLRADEIVSQLLLVKKDNPEQPVTNIVFMGMGEPLANYENTLKAIRILNHPDCLGIAARRITISTCGLPDAILQLAKENIQFELSISLHAADNDTRNRLMPINKKFPLNMLMKAAREYTQVTNRMITFEYVIMDGINDSIKAALDIAHLFFALKCKLNIIPFNPAGAMDFKRVKKTQLEEFTHMLQRLKINFTLRRSRGADIQGACGQLRANLDKGLGDSV
ncbi:MAG: 23S rRNA (adenine(2503)-C(2))-methyltransferase RlmN [Candidatus Omnitrophota bacterium]